MMPGAPGLAIGIERHGRNPSHPPPLQPFFSHLLCKSMKPAPPIDTAAAHKWFSVEYFNRVWGLLDQPSRTAEEQEDMIRMSHASFAHWKERPDCGPKENSIGYWQLARVYAVAGQPEMARLYGFLSLEAAATESPFYIAYAHEAIARAAKTAGNADEMKEHLERAQALAPQVDNAEERQWLEADLASLRETPASPKSG
jgi:hypothetical protein